MGTSTRKTVLLVENEVIIAMSGNMTLERLGYQPVTAHSAEKAIEIVHGEDPIDMNA